MFREEDLALAKDFNFSLLTGANQQFYVRDETEPNPEWVFTSTLTVTVQLGQEAFRSGVKFVSDLELDCIRKILRCLTRFIGYENFSRDDAPTEAQF